MKNVIIFITGGPGTGKSHTASEIANKYPEFELVSYDYYKELYWEKYGFNNKEEKENINKISLKNFYDVLDRKMEVGTNIITEYPFYQRHKDELKKLVDKNNYQAITILLYGDKKFIYENEKKRNKQLDRHIAHVVDKYSRNDNTKVAVKPIEYTYEEFWKLIENKDYDINIGTTYKIDITNFTNVDLSPIYKKINELNNKGETMSKLIEMNEKFPQTELWTDSFNPDDHAFGLSQGMVGITTSPTWVSKMMTNEPLEENAKIVSRLHKENPNLNEIELTWFWTIEMGKIRSKVMLPIWKKGDPKRGRFSIQTSIYEYNNYERMLQMARDVNSCGPNMQVKIPCTEGGIKAIEQATYEGISCMGTQCFSVDQAIAAAEAVERAFERRTKEGLKNDMINPMIALLPGMQDETLKSHCERLKLVIHPDALNWGGIAVAKKTINILKERKYHIRPLIAYYRSYLHWSEFIGADCAQTIPVKWQRRIENCNIEIKDYFSVPVDEKYIKELQKLPLFDQVYNEGSLKLENFVDLEPVVNTFRYFTSEYQKAVNIVRDICLKEFK